MNRLQLEGETTNRQLNAIYMKDPLQCYEKIESVIELGRVDVEEGRMKGGKKIEFKVSSELTVQINPNQIDELRKNL